MKLTLLLDLDNTLLDSSMDSFLPAYFQAFSTFFRDQVDPQIILPALMSGTREMMANTDPSRTLRQVFDAEFFPKIGLTREEFQPRIDQFYVDVFPTLRYLTSPRPEAVELVEWALAQGAQLAVATNPLFPLAAIHHRMRWAGLPPEEYPFSVVSAYEAFHFAKPNPAYFAEVLGQMGWPEGAVLMVGDDTDRDLPGCNTLGLSTYWISVPDEDLPAEISTAGRGSIADLRPWLERTDLSTLEPAFSTPEALMALMLSTPAVVSGLLASFLKPGQAAGPAMKRPPVAKEWSLTETLCHLRDSELEVNLPRLRMLLELDEPFIPARDTDSWAIERDYQSQDGTEALRNFCETRVRTVELLSSLKDEWKRKARHAIFGPTNLQEMVKFMTEHDKLHIRQIRSTVELLQK